MTAGEWRRGENRKETCTRIRKRTKSYSQRKCANGMATELVARAIAQQDWLDPVADTAQPTIDRALTAAGGQPLKDFLNGVWLEHPLHPVLTDIPIGAWTMTAVLDALEEINGPNDARQGADTALKIGLVGAVGAAVTGMADWEHHDGQPRRIGLMHALLNTTTAALYARSWHLRTRRQRRAGRGYAFLGFAISMRQPILAVNSSIRIALASIARRRHSPGSPRPPTSCRS